MALLDFFRRKAQSDSERIPIISEIATQLFNRLMPDRSNSELYRGWVFAAVQVIAEQVANIDLRLYEKSNTGDKQQVFDHDALKLLDYVNEGSTSYDLFFGTGAHCEINGKYYWIVLPNGLGVPSEFMLPDPTKMKPIIDVYGKITSYHYFLQGNQFAEIDPTLVVPFRNFNPSNNFEGMSTLEAARTAAETDDYAKTYNRNWFKNSARPDIVLKFDTDLSKDQKEKLKEEWKSRYAGVNNTGKMLIAPKGMTVDVLSQNHQDMEYIEQRKFSREELLGIFRVPKTLIGLTEEVNRASAEAAMYAFIAFTILPKYKRIVNSLNEYYLPMFKGAENMRFEFANKPPEDPQALVATTAEAINNGLMTLNEGRRVLNLPKIEGGDVVFLPFGLSAYGGPKVAPKQIALPENKKQDGFVTKAASDLADALKKHIDDEHQPVATNVHVDPLKLVDPTKAGPAKPLSADFEEKGVKRGQSKDDLLKPFEAKFKEASQKLWEDQKIRAIMNVKKMNKGKNAIKKAVDVLDPNLEIKLTIDAFTPLFKDLIATAGAEALKYIGSKEDFDTEKASDFIKKNTTRFAKEVTAKTGQDLRVLIAAGIDQGESINDLTARIQNYVGFSESRSETIARTESIRGGAAADIEAWSQSGIVKSYIWYTALDERVDDFCQFLHGTEVDLGSEFMNEDQLLELGVEPYGGSLNSPPAHPNCRCLLIPVTE